MCLIYVLETRLWRIMNRVWREWGNTLIAGVLISLFSSAVFAVEVKDLYSAEVLVIDQSESKRNAAAQDALAEVLIRVSGSAQILLDQNIRRELHKPDAYLLQYSYAQSDQTLLNRAGEEVPAKWLFLSFDPSLVLKSLIEAGLPVWGSNRAQVIVWWGVEDQGDRYLLSANEEGTEEENGRVKKGVVERLYQETNRRGVPVTIPLMDLQDSAAVKTSDVWGFFTENIEVASRRYGPEAILVGRAMPALTGEWLGSWMLLLDGQSYWYEGTASSVDYLLAEAIDNVAERLAEKYAVIVREDAALGITLKVFDIKELKDYAAVSAYLDALVPVRKALLRQVEGDILTFNIILDGDMKQLKQAIELNDKLLPVVGVPVIARKPTGKLLPDGYVDVGRVDDGRIDDGRIDDGRFIENPQPELAIQQHLQYRWIGD